MASTSGVQQQPQQQQFQQPFKCKECGLVLNSAESLEVHKQYHEGNLMQQWAVKEEKNNNMTKQQSAGIKREFAPNNSLDNPDIQKKSPEYQRATPEGMFGHPPTPQSYQSASSPYQSNDNSTAFSPNFQNYSNINVKTEDVSPASQQPQNHYHQQNFPPFPEQQQQQFFSIEHNSPYAQDSPYAQEMHSNKHAMPVQSFRYQPYGRPQYYEASKPQAPTSPTYPPQPTPSPSPKQCDKCGYVCESAAQLIEHNTLAHSQKYPQNNHFMFDQQAPPIIIKEEDVSQSEILDLDSQKVVHPEWAEQKEGDKLPKVEPGIPHSVSTMLNSWPPSNQPQQSANMFQNEHAMYMNEPGEPKMFHNMGEQKLFPQMESQNFMSNGVSSSNPEMGQSYRPFEHLPTAPGSVITSTQVPQVPSVTPSGPPNPKSSSWKSNEARRPKTYNCTACNKWFTSSGHLKRHYNTTLHKNAVKSSGQPDPAVLPISAHHHPARDSPQSKDDRGGNSSSPREDSRGEDSNGMTAQQYDNRLGPMPGLLQHPPNGPYDRPPLPHHTQPMVSPLGAGSHIMQNPSSFSTHSNGSPPNGEAGLSSPDSRGLLSTTSFNPMMQHHQSHHMVSPMEAATHQFQMYPNEYAPHVTQATDITTNSLSTTGEDEQQQQYVVQQEPQPLPSFSQLSAHRFNTAGYANVGGLGTVTVPASLTFFNTDGFDFNEVSRNIIFKEDSFGYKLAVITTEDQHSINDVSQMSQLSPTSSNNNNEVSFGELTESTNIPYLSPDGSEHLNHHQPLQQPLSISTESQCDSSKENYEESTSTGSPSISSTVSSQEDVSKTKCFDCDKVFNRPCYLTQHNKTCHNGDKPFKCSRCGKRFSDDLTYKEHIKKHAGDKPHKCDMCPKMFNHKTDLRRHLCCHTGRKPFACEICGKGFIRKDHMIKHMETHQRKKDKHNVKQVVYIK